MNPQPAIEIEQSDRSLLREFRKGDQQAAEVLYVRYASRIRALIQANCSMQLSQRVDPDDVMQSVFRSFFEGASQGLYDAPQGTELWRLLLVIALNKLKKEERRHRTGKRSVDRTQAISADTELPAYADNAHDWEYVVMQLTIEEALAKLPTQHRLMMELRLQGYEVAEIAERSGRSKRSVERCLQDVRKHLKATLEQGE